MYAMLHVLPRLQQVQTQLQSHRIWLRAFVATHNLIHHHHHHHSYTPAPKRAFATASARHDPLPFRRRKGAKPPKRWTTNSGPKKRPLEVELRGLSQRADLLDALQKEDLKTAMALYAALPEKKPLEGDDVRALAQHALFTLRRTIFTAQAPHARDDKAEIMAFAERLTEDIRKGLLLPSTHAHVLLLAMYKESNSRHAGIAFWSWLETQDETFVSTEVYAVAIELLAIDGLPLPRLELLYQAALTRFPGTFAAYHLSPEAVLPDRERPIGIPAINSHLLSSIAFARLLRGDSRNAYLALDTVLRIFPTTTNVHFLAHFWKERPVAEMFTIWAMACRAGIPLRINDLKNNMFKIRLSSDLTSATFHVAIIRTLIAAIYLSTTSPHHNSTVNEILIATAHIFRLDGILSLAESQRKLLLDSVLDAIRRMMQLFARYGNLPTTTAFNAMISEIGGYARTPDVVNMIIADMQKIGLEHTAVTRRGVMKAAGRLKDATLVMRTWIAICSEHASAGTQPEDIDWTTFILAAKRADCATFAQIELDNKILNDPRQSKPRRLWLQGLLRSDEFDTPAFRRALRLKDASLIDFDELMQSINKLKADIALIEERTRDKLGAGPTLEDFKKQNIPTVMISSGDALALPEHEMRKLYDEFTTDPTSQPTSTVTTSEDSNPQDSASRAEPSLTNSSLGEIRYENWKSMNYLLWLADMCDRKHEEVVDRAIAAGVAPPARDSSLALKDMEFVGLSDATVRDEAEIPSGEEQVQKVRAEILRLRGRT